MMRMKNLIIRIAMLSLFCVLLLCANACASGEIVTLPISIRVIEDEAFFGATSMTEAILQENVESIGARAFAGCTNLAVIEITASVKNIAEDAFADCEQLATLRTVAGSYAAEWFRKNVPDAQIEYTDAPTPTELFLYEQLYDTDTDENFIQIKKYLGTVASKVIIPEMINGLPVRAVGKDAFRETKVTDVLVPNSVTYIGNSAFYNCTNLSKIMLSNRLTTILHYAFSNCTNLSEIALPDCLTFVGKYAFSECTSLSGIILPTHLTTLGEGAFSYCTNLSKVILPDDLTYIDISLFDGCEKLTKITLPNSLTVIGNNAFFGCYSLIQIILPNNLKRIGGGAFSYCSNLAKIILPDSLSILNNSAFSNCTSLTAIDLPDSLISIGGYAFSACTSLTAIDLPDSLTSIGGYAFSACTSLTAIDLPDSLTSIGGYAFSACTSLTVIDLPDGVTSIGENAFINCTSLTAIDLSNSLNSIGEWAFAYSGLMTIDLPDSVTSIGNYAFYDCNWLKTVDFPDKLTSVSHYAFQNCINLTTINLPNSLTSIGDSAFSGCERVTAIDLPDSVTSIGDSTFYGCEGLTAINLPDSVTSIGDCTFYNCTSLTEITMPNSLTSIGNGAFSSCTSLNTVCCVEGSVADNYTGFPSDIEKRYYTSETLPTPHIVEITLPVPGSELGRKTQEFAWKPFNGTATYSYALRDLALYPGDLSTVPDAYVFKVDGHTGEAITVTDTQLIGGHDYRFWVAAVNANGRIIAQKSVEFTVKTHPVQITAPVDQSKLRCETQEFSWVPYSGAASYSYALRDLTLYPGDLSTVPDAYVLKVDEYTGEAITVTADQLMCGHNYRFWVGVRDAEGAIFAQNSVEFSLEDEPPSNPVIIGFDAEDASIVLGQPYVFLGTIDANGGRLKRVLIEVVEAATGHICDYAIYDRESIINSGSDGTNFDLDCVTDIQTGEGSSVATSESGYARPESVELSLCNVGAGYTIAVYAENEGTNCLAKLEEKRITLVPIQPTVSFEKPDDTIVFGNPYAFEGIISSNGGLLNMVWITIQDMSNDVICDYAIYARDDINNTSGDLLHFDLSSIEEIPTGSNADAVIGTSGASDAEGNPYARNESMSLEMNDAGRSYRVLIYAKNEEMENVALLAERRIAYYYLNVESVTAPTGELELGNPFYLKGIIASSDPILSVTAKISNAAATETIQSITVTPNAKSHNMSGIINNSIIFGDLPQGDYKYEVVASTAKGTKLLVRSMFTIIKTPLRYYITGNNAPIGFIANQYVFDGFLQSNYPVIEVEASITLSGGTAKKYKWMPNSKTFNLNALNDSIGINAHTMVSGQYNFKLSALIDNTECVLMDTQFYYFEKQTGILDQKGIEQMWNFVNDNEMMFCFNGFTEYMGFIDSMGSYETILVGLTNRNKSVWELVRSVFIENGQRRSLIDLYKNEICEIVSRIDEGQGVAEYVDNDTIEAIYKMADGVKEYLGSYIDTVGIIAKAGLDGYLYETEISGMRLIVESFCKDGFDAMVELSEQCGDDIKVVDWYGEFVELMMETCKTYLNGMRVLDAYTQNSVISGKAEFTTALQELREDYANKGVMIARKAVNDIARYGFKEANKALIKNSLKAISRSVATSYSIVNFSIDFGLLISGGKKEAKTYEELITQIVTYTSAAMQYQSVFGQAANGDRSPESLTKVATSFRVTAAAGVRLYDTMYNIGKQRSYSKEVMDNLDSKRNALIEFENIYDRYFGYRDDGSGDGSW